MSRAWRTLHAIGTLWAGVACGQTPQAIDPEPIAVEASPAITRVALEGGPIEALSGLSGLTRDDSGRLWTLPERQPSLVSLAVDGSSIEVIDLAGVPADTDLESLTHLGGSRFAAGAEHRDARGHDEILFIDVGPGGARVGGQRLRLQYERWGTRGVGNQGIEGLCAAGEWLVAAIESTVGVGADRTAPLALVSLAARADVAMHLSLTTATGKIAALDCHLDGDAIVVFAIERHFEVARVLRVVVDPAAVSEGDRLRPEVVVDWSAQKRERDNPEGLARLPGGAFAIILDNDFGGAVGPNTLLSVRP